MKMNSNPSPIKRSRDVTDINRTSSLRHRFTIIISASVHCTPVVKVFGNRGNGRLYSFRSFSSIKFPATARKTWNWKALFSSCCSVVYVYEVYLLWSLWWWGVRTASMWYDAAWRDAVATASSSERKTF